MVLFFLDFFFVDVFLLWDFFVEVIGEFLFIFKVFCLLLLDLVEVKVVLLFDCCFVLFLVDLLIIIVLLFELDGLYVRVDGLCVNLFLIFVLLCVMIEILSVLLRFGGDWLCVDFLFFVGVLLFGFDFVFLVIIIIELCVLISEEFRLCVCVLLCGSVLGICVLLCLSGVGVRDFVKVSV